jgi:integrase
LGENLGLPKLTFQVIRRSIATLGQKKGTPKDIQSVLRHSRMATTTDVYMQEIPENVKATVAAIDQELKLIRQQFPRFPANFRLKQGEAALVSC